MFILFSENVFFFYSLNGGWEKNHPENVNVGIANIHVTVDLLQWAGVNMLKQVFVYTTGNEQ